MKDKSKSVEQLIAELSQMRKRLNDARFSETKQRQLLSTLAASIPGVVYRSALEADYIRKLRYISDEIYELSGYPAVDFIDNQVRTLSSIIHQDDQWQVRQTISNALSCHEPYTIEYRIVHANGSILWVFEKGQGVFFENKLISLAGVIFDITQRKLMEQELDNYRNNLEELVIERTAELAAANQRLKLEIAERQQVEALICKNEEKYRTLVEQASDGIFIIDENYNILDVNAKGCVMLGYTYGEILARRLPDFLPPEDYHTLLCETVKVQNGETSLQEWQLIGKHGGILPVETSAKMLGDNHIQCIVRDITERKQLEKEIARLDRLSLVGEMAVGIGHEIRNPMTTVRGFLQRLCTKQDCQRYQEHFNLMIEELDKANAIITDFLSLAKDKAIQRKNDNLNGIVKTLMPLLEAEALLHNSAIVLNLQDVPCLMLDDKEIGQLVINLTRNGLEAMKAGGCLTIKTHTEDSAVILAIQDQGHGIPIDIGERLGTPFFTTKDYGTGLGLALCYSIAARHNAIIDFTSSSRGTTFFVQFKLSGS